MADFKFDLTSKKVRFTNGELLSSLRRYAEKHAFQYFSTTEFNSWNEKIAGAETICKRFGSWNRALKEIGIEGGHERRYSADELIENLEEIWKEIGYPPGKRQLSKYGKKISESPYKKYGAACHLRAKCSLNFIKVNYLEKNC